MCTVSKFSTKRVKRPRANWYVLLCYIGDEKLYSGYYLLLSRHPNMSPNRLAYYVLKSNYSTTALERWRWFGEVPL